MYKIQLESKTKTIIAKFPLKFFDKFKGLKRFEYFLHSSAVDPGVREFNAEVASPK
jgi:hypothetical protein